MNDKLLNAIFNKYYFTSDFAKTAEGKQFILTNIIPFYERYKYCLIDTNNPTEIWQFDNNVQATSAMIISELKTFVKTVK